MLGPLADPAVDIATLAAEIHVEEERTNPNVVKMVGSPIGAAAAARAVFYPRHRALGRWAALPSHRSLRLSARGAASVSSTLAPSTLERREKLEQLRALEAGMRIDVSIVDTVPRGVDTPADLETTRQHTGEKLSGCYKARHDQRSDQDP